MEPWGTNGGPLLVTVTGPDHPGLAAGLFRALAATGAVVSDVEQVTIHGQLLLAMAVHDVVPQAVAAALAREPVTVLTPPPSPEAAPGTAAPMVQEGQRAAPSTPGSRLPTVELTRLPSDTGRQPHRARQLVTMLAPTLHADDLACVFGAVAGAGGNVERILQLAQTPVVSYELQVTGADSVVLRRLVAEAAAACQIDAAVQRAGLHRRASHLIVMDVDSTLVQGEVVDLLAAEAGKGSEVAAITAAAMAGALDFEEALRQRVALLAGLDAGALDRVRSSLVLTPGARTLVRTLHRLGYATAVVSGGFDQVIEPIAAELGIAHVAANHLEIVDDTVTGKLVGPVVDRAGKAEALRRFAAAVGVPPARTVAVGDGANDLDMLSAAGLGIAFNAKPVVRDAADTALSVPYLDSILYLLGVPRSEIEDAEVEELEERRAQP